MESKVDHAWTSHVEKACRGHKSKSSPVDDIADTEVAGVKNDAFSPRFCSTKDRNKSQKIKHSGNNCTGSEFRNGDVDGHGFAKNCSDKATLDRAFIEELCKANGILGDDWIHYYNILFRLLCEQGKDPKPKDTPHKDAQEHAHGEDGSGNDDGIGSRRRPNTRHPGSRKSTSTVTTDKVCSKCGYVKQNEDCSDSPVKNRVHFVNGACVSSSPKCACSKPAREQSSRTASGGNVAEESAKPSTKSHLSSSELEFYRNLRYYFGSGRVKNRKAPEETEDKGESVKRSGLGQACSETHHVHETKLGDSSSLCDGQKSETTANVKEKPGRHKEKEGGHKEKECRDKENEGQHKEKEGRHNCAPHPAGSVQHGSCGESSKKVPSESSKKSQASGEEKKTSSHGSKAFRESDDKTKTTSKSKSQTETKGEHRKHSKDDTKSKVDSQGKPQKPKHNTKTKPVPKTNKKDKVEQNELEVDLLSEVSKWLNDSGREMVIKCGNIVRSLAIYAFILVMLVFGFVMYCIWIAGCHMYRKSIEYTRLDKWLASARAKFSEWRRLFPKPQEPQQRNSGQRHSYELPRSGEEAVNHMLGNKGNKDLYSVIGLPASASDDEIKRHYRKLSLLIHPDKNPHPLAGEAFKVLANAFDILGNPEKRMKHDRKAARKKMEEEMRNRSPFQYTAEDVFATVYTRMQEMANYLYCHACNEKHRRYKTDRSMLDARYCSRCDKRHPAKEGDLWAETKCLGLKLYFYACMEGEIYDVTDWAKCQGIQQYHVKANAHTTHLKIKTRQSPRAGCSKSSSKSEDEQFEEFVRTVFGEPPFEDENTPGSKKERRKKQKKKKR